MTSNAKSTTLNWRLWLRLAAGLALLAFLFSHYADLREVGRLIRGAEVRWLLLALFIAITGEIITAYKWRLLIAHIGGNLPILKSINASFIGMFYNNFFPGSVGGDIARVLLIAREAGGKARATASTFMQRNTGLAGLFAVGLPAAFLWPLVMDLPDENPLREFLGKELLVDSRFWLISLAIGYAGVNLILFSRTVYHLLWKLVKYEEHHPVRGRIHGVIRKGFQKLQRFHSELHSFRFWLPAPLLISVFTQMVDVVLVWCLAKAIGTSVELSVLMVAVSLVTVASLAPVTINGIGLREALYVALLHPVGIPADAAIAISLLKFAVITAMAAIGGILHMLGTDASSKSLTTGH